MFEFIKETLDRISFFVQVLIVCPLGFTMTARRDDRLGTLTFNLPEQPTRIVALGGQKGSGAQPFDEFIAPSRIIVLTCSKDQTDRQPQGVRARVDFGAQPAPRPAKTLGIRPPFSLRAPAAYWWARITVESIISHSISASLESAANILSSTPTSSQR
jgi:hypothetical protein